MGIKILTKSNRSLDFRRSSDDMKKRERVIQDRKNGTVQSNIKVKIITFFLLEPSS